LSGLIQEFFSVVVFWVERPIPIPYTLCLLVLMQKKANDTLLPHPSKDKKRFAFLKGGGKGDRATSLLRGAMKR
jgi:hypothetical protein